VPKDQDRDLEPTRPAFEVEVTESSPTIRDRRARLEASPNMGEKFDVLGFIGRGGMGAVFKVWHRQLDHVRAVKVLPAGSSPAMVERLRREAAIATDLTHPNIVTVYDLEMLDDGSLAIVMEYLPGEDLNAFIKKNGRMSVEDALRRFRPVADALDRMHAAGVVHRDIKPANLFVCEDGSLKVLDFGISRLTESESGLTRTGGLVGTPSYMAPELFEGESADAKADVYSLGAVLFFCLTGRKPYEGRTQLELISRILADDPPRADDVCHAVPQFVANALERALTAEADQRWPTAMALLEAMGSEETRAFRAPRVVRRRRRRWLTALSMAAGLAISATIGVVASDVLVRWSNRSDDPVYGGSLALGLRTRLPSLDPLEAKTTDFVSVVHLLYDPLVEVDWRGNLEPALTKSWEQLDGDRRYVLHLRDDAILHPDPCLPDPSSSHALDGEDVRASLERTFRYIAEDEDTTWGFLPPVVGFDEYLAGEVDHPAGIRVPTSHTVEVTFTRPAPSFLHCLNRSEWSIMAAESIDEYGPKHVGFHAVGSGPFRVVAASSLEVEMERHDGFWRRDAKGGRLPYLNRLVIKTYHGETGAVAALRQESVDVVLRITPEQLDEALVVDGWAVTPREGWEAYSAVPYLDEAHRYLTLLLMDRRSDHPYTESVEIRQAIRTAIDRRSLLEGPFLATDSPLTDGMLGYEARLTSDGDVDEAKRLLKAAGYPEGSGLPSLDLCCRDGITTQAYKIEEQLELAGFVVNTNVVGYDPWHRFLTQGGCDMVIAMYDELVINDDPTELLLGLTSRARLMDRRPHVGDLVRDLRTVERQEDRESLIRHLAAELVDDSVLVFLEYRDPTAPHVTNLIGPRVRGLADPQTGNMNQRRERIRRMWTPAGDDPASTP